MANEAIGILFEVQGGGDINGATGKRINGQLQQIIGQMNKAGTFKLKFQIDSNYFSQQIKQLQQQLQELSAGSTSAASGKSSSSSSGAKKTAPDMDTYRRASKALRDYYDAQAKFDKQSSRSAGGNIFSGLAEAAAAARAAAETYFDIVPREYDKATGEVVNATAKVKREILGLTNDQRQSLDDFANAQTSSYNISADKTIQNAQNAWGGLTAKVHDYIRNVEDSASRNEKASDMLRELRDMANSTDYHGYDALKQKLAEVQQYINENSLATETWGQKLAKTFGSRVRSALAGIITVKIGQYLRDILNNVVALDQAAVNLQIASGKTRTEVKRLMSDYADLAKQIGATTQEVAESADTWLRQGYAATEASTLIQNSTMLSKLGLMGSTEASTALTSAMKGYKVSVEDSLKIVDKFTAVDMEAAASAGDIATAMAETATSANIAGVSMDKLIGYIATVKEVTQDGAESVGTFYKTLFARMNNVAAGNFVDSETGESLNDVETVLNKLGIALRDTNGLFKKSGDVLDEVGRKWSTFDNVQQHAIATAFAGTRQQEKFIVLMENYGTAMSYASTAASSSGTAVEKYNAYLDSIDGKMNSLKATFEELSMTILNSEWVKTGIGILTSIVGVLNSIAGAGNGVIVMAVAVSAAILLLNTAFKSARVHMSLLIKKYAELAGVQVSGAITTQMFSAAMLQFSSSGLLGVITAIPRFIAAIIKYIVSAKAGTGATLTFKGALDLLKVNPIVLAIEAAVLVIVGAVAVINKFANAAAEASSKAKEHAQAMQEAADKAKEEQDSLDELIDRYKELRSNGSDNADTRKEIRDIQKQINSLVHGEAKGWDMVNDDLDVTMQKLKKLRAEQAGEKLGTYQQNFAAAQTSSNLAYESERSDAGWAKWAANWARIDLVVDGWDKEAAEILEKVNGVSASWDSNFVTTLTDINFSANGAQEYVERITAAMEALENDENYDHLHSAVYNKLGSLKDVYAAYTSTAVEAADQLLEGIVTFSGATLEANGRVIASMDDYNKFQDDLIEAVMASDFLTDALNSNAVTVDSITEAVKDYMSLNYADVYDKLAAKVAKSNYQHKTFVQILDEVQGKFDVLSQALDDMDERGTLSAETVSKLLDPEKGYPALAKYLTLTANGYTIAQDALESFVKEERESYVAAVAAAEEGSEKYEIAYQNLERFLAVISTLELSKKIQKETDALKSEKDAWNENLSKYKTVVDIRKELLNTYAQELEYINALEKKQRNVSKLQTQLSVARLDTSAAGQARVRELESELQDAQDELDDFTLDHAIETLTSQLDSQYEQYEQLVTSETDRITEAIDNIAQTIKDNATNSEAYIQELIDDYKKRYPDATTPSSPPTQNAGNTSPVSPARKSTLSNGTDYQVSGLSNGLSMGKDDISVTIDGTKYNVKVHTKSISEGVIYNALNSMFGGQIPTNGTVAMYDGSAYITKKGSWRLLVEEDVEKLKEAYSKKLGSTYHTGGIVGDVSLKSNEEFAKLLKGEFVSTPAQMQRFMERTLPQIAGYTSFGGTNEFNAPLIEITCGSVTSETMPKLEQVVHEAVKEVQKQLDGGMSRTGYKRSTRKLLC